MVNINLILSNGNENLTFCESHNHNCFEIIILSNGECETYCGSETFKMEENSILIIPPGIYHSNNSQSSYSDIFLQIDVLPMNIKQPVFLHDYSGNILRIAKLINQIELKSDRKYSLVINNLLASLVELISAIRDEDYHHDISGMLKSDIERNISNCCYSIKEFSHKNGYNYDYVRKCFRADIGITPLEYLMSLRLSRAASLLKTEQQYTVKEIASMCGFSDQYYFSRVFKKHNGISPKGYRV